MQYVNMPVEIDEKTLTQIAGTTEGNYFRATSNSKLKEVYDIPEFHDAQPGTAVVTMAAMLNALKLTGEKLENLSVVVNGSGSAGIAITKLLMSKGLKNVVLCDRKGAIY